jgi:hypothetical protein
MIDAKMVVPVAVEVIFQVTLAMSVVMPVRVKVYFLGLVGSAVAIMPVGAWQFLRLFSKGSSNLVQATKPSIERRKRYVVFMGVSILKFILQS